MCEQMTTLRDHKGSILLRPNGKESRTVKENIVFARVFKPAAEVASWRIIGSIDDAKKYQPITQL